jgi:hypothetical protein
VRTSQESKPGNNCHGNPGVKSVYLTQNFVTMVVMATVVWLTHSRKGITKVDDGDTHFSTCFANIKFVCTSHEMLMTISAFIILAQVSQLRRPRCALSINVYDMHTKFQIPRPDGILSSKPKTRFHARHALLLRST